MRKILVKSGKPYEVILGRELLNEVAKSISPSVSQVAIIHAPVMMEQANELAQKLSEVHRDLECHLVVAPDSETAKNFDFVQNVWNKLGELRFTRSDLIISIGGGATTDVSGFIAATWLRGIAIIHVPTTLLAMVDAAVGGKTGINTTSGKNLVGAFHNPQSVWCDLNFLNTLPENDLRAGFAEVIKCGFIQDNRILNLVSTHKADILKVDSAYLLDAIEYAISVKANVVASDFKEDKDGGLGREILNYGHTLGHAIENLENYKWRHGDAISIGMMFAAYLSLRTGICESELVKSQQTLLNSLGLPTTYDGDFRKVQEIMSIDKKARGKTLRFIGLSQFGKPQVISAPSSADLIWSFEQISGGKK